jgi:hypothetical protein
MIISDPVGSVFGSGFTNTECRASKKVVLVRVVCTGTVLNFELFYIDKRNIYFTLF